MSTIRTQFESLKLRDKLDNTIQLWATLKTENLQPSQLEDIERLLRVLNFINAHIAEADPEIYPANIWNSINNYIANIQSLANSFKSNKNVGYIQNANNEVDSILSSLRPWGIKQPSNLIKTLAKSERDFTQELLKLLSEVKASRDNWNAQIQSFSQKLEELKTRQNQADQTIQSQKQRLDNSITEFQNQFSTAQETRRTEFNATVQKNSKRAEELIEKQNTTFNSNNEQFQKAHKATLEQISAASEKSLQDVSDIEEKIRRIFNVVGNIALTGNYNTTANNESKEANRFRWISLALMGLMAVMAGITFINGLLHPEVDWKLFAFRLGATLIIALPALYAAQESAKHREREKMNRKLHLELSAIDAYLELLPDDKKHELKGKLTEKFFGQNEPQSKEEQLTKHELFNLVADILKTLSKNK